MLELSLHILDIAENSVRAGAKLINISVIEDTAKDRLYLCIEDDGSGMSEDAVKKVLDPFYTTKTVRRVGLGLPLLSEAAGRAEGQLSIASQEGIGTKIDAEFRMSHIDRQPMGNIVQTMISLIAGNPDIDFVFTHSRDKKSYVLDTREIKKGIDDIPINNVEVLRFIRQSIEGGLSETGGSWQHEKA